MAGVISLSCGSHAHVLTSSEQPDCQVSVGSLSKTLITESLLWRQTVTTMVRMMTYSNVEALTTKGPEKLLETVSVTDTDRIVRHNFKQGIQCLVLCFSYSGYPVQYNVSYVSHNRKMFFI